MQGVEDQRDVLLRSLSAFYEDAASFEAFRSVVAGQTRMSLRVLDWLVTNYAKKYNVVYPTVVNGREVVFNMFVEYKSQLKAYSKQLFDPFCRRRRIVFRDVTTTCGQLNFFRWTLQYGVLAYAEEHHDAIEQDMLKSIQHRSSATTSREDMKRKELSKAAIKGCTTTKVRVKVMFS